MAITIYTDGGSRNNPGKAGIGATISRGGTRLFELSEYIGIQTNNWAEYQAVIRALEELITRNITSEPISINMDSLLVVEQMNGNWKIKEPSLKPQAARVQELRTHFPEVSFSHVRREFNKEADALVNKAVDEAL